MSRQAQDSQEVGHSTFQTLEFCNDVTVPQASGLSIQSLVRDIMALVAQPEERRESTHKSRGVQPAPGWRGFDSEQES